MSRIGGVLRVCVLLLAGSASGAAFGACAHGADGTDYCGPDLIQQLYVTKTGIVYVKPNTALSPLPAGFACAPVSGAYLILDPSSPNFKQLYAALLTARISAAPVTLAIDPTLHDCTITYVVL